MRIVTAIAELPHVPSVYALYRGRDQGLYIAYVGIARDLNMRIVQHLVRRDSSIATGVSAAHLNPNQVTEVRWWEHSDFGDQATREAAELVAFDVLDPVLRSRGSITDQARRLFADEGFRTTMREVFSALPVGRLILPTFQEAFRRIVDLEQRLAAIEARLGQM